MKIKHNNKNYVLNVEKAINAGLLTEQLFDPTNLKPGDVFSNGGSINSFLLVRIRYENSFSPDINFKGYQLLGMGCSPNSGDFFQELRSLVEVADYLSERKMRHVANIDGRIANLVMSFDK